MPHENNVGKGEKENCDKEELHDYSIIAVIALFRTKKLSPFISSANKNMMLRSGALGGKERETNYAAAINRLGGSGQCNGISDISAPIIPTGVVRRREERERRQERKESHFRGVASSSPRVIHCYDLTSKCIFLSACRHTGS